MTRSDPEYCPVRSDNIHCNCWYDGGLCCGCRAGDDHGPLSPGDEFTNEEQAIAATIRAARTVQDCLWGKHNEKWPLEEWRRMIRKRVAKMDAITMDNPHALIELKKRLLQTAAVAVNLLVRLERGIPKNYSTNLGEYAHQGAKGKEGE